MENEPRELEINLPHLTLAALEWGRPDRPLLLALHGWMDNAASFRPLAPYLDGYRLVAVDMAGHGRSEHRPAGVPYDLPGYMADILAVMDCLDAGKATLIGHSMGAALASFVAATFPERVGRLVLLEGLAPLSEPPAKAPGRLRKAVRRMGRAPAQSATAYPDVGAAVKARARRGAMSERAAAHLVRRGTAAGPGGIRWRSDLRAAEPSPFYLTQEQVLAFLGSIECPAFLIKGEAGLLAARPEKSAVRERAGPNLEGVEVAGGPHLHMETPGEVARHVCRFLR